MQTDCDVLIAGNGLAALTLALSLPESFRIVILCKSRLDDTASHHAQGGIAAAWSREDDIEKHVADTLEAGAGLCNEAAVRTILSQGKPAIEWLLAQGVAFDRNYDGLHLTREARAHLPPNRPRRRLHGRSRHAEPDCPNTPPPEHPRLRAADGVGHSNRIRRGVRTDRPRLPNARNPPHPRPPYRTRRRRLGADLRRHHHAARMHGRRHRYGDTRRLRSRKPRIYPIPPYRLGKAV